MSLEKIFAPKSIAVIGASKSKGKIGWEILHNLLMYGFKGKVYPVNPNASEVHSIKCYPSVLDIEEEVELAIIAVPSKLVLKVVEECGKRGVKGLVVITAGFGERNEHGKKLEKELNEIVNRYGMRMIGPNCMGIINTADEVRMNATFATALPLQGKLSFLSQSGALCAAILEHAKNIRVGFAKFVSTGNATNVSSNDLLAEFGKDENTDIILMYIEHFGNPRNFTKYAREISKNKPIIALKSGRTEAGSRAALSHTGALAGSDIAADALFEQCGVLRVLSVEELFDYAVAFSMQELPKGNKVAIITNAGGPGIMATDACIYVGLELAKLSGETMKELNKALPTEASKKNPIDMIADADAQRYEKCMNAVLKDKGVDAVIVIFVPPIMTNEIEVAKTISIVAKKFSKPVLACFMGSGEASQGFMELVKGNIPAYQFPENAIRALSAMYRYNIYKNREEGVIRQFKVDKKKVKTIFSRSKNAAIVGLDALEVLNAYGLPIAETKLVKNVEEAAKAVKETGYPIALKVFSDKLIHKTEHGAIILDIRNGDELLNAYLTLNERMKEKKIVPQGYIVQEMVKDGMETIVGMSYDKKFGPILMFGLGGIYVEILKDLSFRLTPLTDLDAIRMISSIKSYPILCGARGEKPRDIEGIANCLERIAKLVTDFHEIEQIDINPLMALEKGKGCKVVDARIVIRTLSPSPRSA